MLGLVCPTKGRLEGFDRLTHSLVANAMNKAGYPAVAVLNTNDPTPYHPARNGYASGWEYLMLTNCDGSLEAFNAGVCYLLRKYPEVRYVVMLNDDLIIRTPGWDVLLLDALSNFPDDYGVVYPDDGWRQQPTFPVLSRKWITTLGYYCPPGFKTWYPDAWHANIAARVRRLRYIPEVVFEHNHASFGKSAEDETHKAGAGNAARIDHDAALWFATAGKRAEDAEKIRRVIDESRTA